MNHDDIPIQQSKRGRSLATLLLITSGLCLFSFSQNENEVLATTSYILPNAQTYTSLNQNDHGIFSDLIKRNCKKHFFVYKIACFCSNIKKNQNENVFYNPGNFLGVRSGPTINSPFLLPNAQPDQNSSFTYTNLGLLSTLLAGLAVYSSRKRRKVSANAQGPYLLPMSMQSKKKTKIRSNFSKRNIVSVTARQPESPSRVGLDEVEIAVRDFIPAIVTLRELGNQLLRDQLPKALNDLKKLDKPEIYGYLEAVGSEIRTMVQKLSAFRQTAQALREREIRAAIRSAPLNNSSPTDVPSLPKETTDTNVTIGGSSSSTQPAGGSGDLQSVFVVGMSHQTGNVSLREKLAVPESNWNKWSKNLVDYATKLNGGREIINGAAIISTCNRFEVIFSASKLNGFAARELVFRFLEAQSGLPVEELKPFLMVLDGDKASWHLFRVASGLESLVLGENQILSQVSRCHQLGIMPATKENGNVAGSAGKVIGRLLQMTIGAARRVRSSTAIGEGKVQERDMKSNLQFSFCCYILFHFCLFSLLLHVFALLLLYFFSIFRYPFQVQLYN